MQRRRYTDCRFNNHSVSETKEKIKTNYGYSTITKEQPSMQGSHQVRSGEVRCC